MRFADKCEVRVFVPNLLRQEQEERIWVVSCLGGPVATFFLRIDDMSLEDLLMRVNEFAILASAELLLVHLINLGRNVAIIEMNPVNLIFLDELDNLLEEQVPGLFLPIVENCTLFVVDSSALTSVEEVLATVLVDGHEFQIFVLLAHPGRTDTGKAVDDKFYVVLF